MNTVGIFAGRGDVVLAMGMAMLTGGIIGWYIHKFKEYLVDKFSKPPR